MDSKQTLSTIYNALARVEGAPSCATDPVFAALAKTSVEKRLIASHPGLNYQEEVEKADRALIAHLRETGSQADSFRISIALGEATSSILNTAKKDAPRRTGWTI